MSDRLHDLLDHLALELKQQNAIAEKDIRFIISPYRICPLGAHIDHQGGPVLGMTIDLYSVLAYAPLAGAEIRLTSLHHRESAHIPLTMPVAEITPPWAKYAGAAAHALSKLGPVTHGFAGAVWGDLPGGGLSSSASVGLAYLLALAEANEIDTDPQKLVHLDQVLENEFLGLQNGILDQTTIVYGRRGHLLKIDTAQFRVTPLRRPQNAKFRILIFYSGVSRALVDSGFNARVAECRAAAEHLSRAAGLPEANRLGQIPLEVFETHQFALPGHLRRRAAHFFSESARVLEGAEAWRRGDLPRFGELMNASCWSSVHQYESGSEPIHRLWEMAVESEGVYGSRFAGGGYGGCVLALVEEAAAESVAREVLERYRSRFPKFAGQARAFFVADEEGVRRL